VDESVVVCKKEKCQQIILVGTSGHSQIGQKCHTFPMSKRRHNFLRRNVTKRFFFLLRTFIADVIRDLFVQLFLGN
jgi:hypothetical protein